MNKKIFVFSLLTLLAVCSVVYLSINQKYEAKAFGPQEWRQSSDIKIRGSMVNDLIDGEILINKSRGEVEEMLGQPDYQDEETVSYLVDIGDRALFGAWTYNLTIKLNTDGVVATVYLLD
jgi:hypothetical protein